MVGSNFKCVIVGAILIFVVSALMIVPQAVALNNPKVGLVSVGPQTPGVIVAGQSATYTITVDRGSGGGSSGAFTAELSISGLPTGASASFSPATVSFSHSDNTQTATLTIVTTSSLAGGSYSFTVTATRSDSAQDYANGGLTVLKVNALPEYPLGILAALFSCFGAFAIFKKVKRP